MFYRVTSNGVGIYQRVDELCPKDSPLRHSKPDGGWLPRAGEKYSDTSSWFTEYGYKKYVESGLAEWHKEVVGGVVEVTETQQLQEAIYQDEYQVLVKH